MVFFSLQRTDDDPSKVAFSYVHSMFTVILPSVPLTNSNLKQQERRGEGNRDNLGALGFP